MRYCIILFCLFFVIQKGLSQTIQTAALKEIKPKEPYGNVAVIPVYNDVNSSAFVIFIKKQVAKHYHETHTETVIVLEGRGEMFLGGKFFKIKAGDQMIIPQGIHHAVIVRSKKPLKVLSIQSPYFDNKDRIIVEN